MSAHIRELDRVTSLSDDPQAARAAERARQVLNGVAAERRSSIGPAVDATGDKCDRPREIVRRLHLAGDGSIGVSQRHARVRLVDDLDGSTDHEQADILEPGQCCQAFADRAVVGGKVRSMKGCLVQLGLRQAEDDISAPGAFRLHSHERLSISFQGHEIGMNDEFAEVNRESLVWLKNAPTAERFMAVRKQPGHATLTEKGVGALDHCWLVEPRRHEVSVVRSYRCRSAGHSHQQTTRQWPCPESLPTLRRWKMPERPDSRGAELPLGLYEQLVTRRVAQLQDELHELAPTRPLLPAEGPQYLTEHVARAVSRALRAPGIGGDPHRQVQLCNALLDLVAREVPGAVTSTDDSVARAALLLAILEQPTGLTPVRHSRRPETPLAQDALFVHAPHEPNLAAELVTELESADRVVTETAS